MTPAARPAPDRDSNPAWTPGRSPCGCWPSSGRRSPSRPPDGHDDRRRRDPRPPTRALRVPRCRRSRRPPPSMRAATVGSRPDLAARLAAAVDGEVVTTDEGCIVRCEPPTRHLPVDRERLATLPGQPPAAVPLVCLDTETTGLATAAGTAAFLIGLGWWVGDRFRQVQLLLPDHGEERALLTALEAAIPPDAWLVTYNGRGFDWPLLTTRYRLSRRAAPAHAGHLDLLPIVRRLYRHRMAGRTPADRGVGAARDAPGRRRGGLGDPRPLPRVPAGRPGRAPRPRSPATTTRTSGRSPGCSPISRDRYGDPEVRSVAPPGDLAGLARAFARERRLPEALDCLEAAVGPAGRGTATGAAGSGDPRVANGHRETPEDAPVVVAANDRRTSVDARHDASRRRRSDPAARPRGRLDDGADRRRSRPPPAPPRAVRGCGRCLVGAGRGPRSDRPSSPRSSWPRSTSIAGMIHRRRWRPSTAVSARSSAAVGWDGPSLRSKRICCGASSGFDRASCPRSACRGSRPLPLDRLDLPVLARCDRRAGMLPGPPDQHGSPIRDAREADVLDRERAGGGGEPKIRRSS